MYELLIIPSFMKNTLWILLFFLKSVSECIVEEEKIKLEFQIIDGYLKCSLCYISLKYKVHSFVCIETADTRYSQENLKTKCGIQE
jgi:hypothetical protein